MRLNSKKVTQIMADKAITESDVAGRTGLYPASMRWILNNGFASYDAMERIADALEVTMQDITAPDSFGSEENVIDFIKDSDRATVTFSQGRYKSRVEQLAKNRPDECRIMARNDDGSLCAQIPVKWVRITPPREVQLTDEQRREIGKRLAKSKE
ncbi:MAG: helix-turn-helix transcriptional regulator [Lachnospiraceae bacterium]|nr:helix-turn-helix transcriptional regulator [Lachnospiraceae bacterium]